MDPLAEMRLLLTRRHFFGLNACGIGAAALANLLPASLAAESTTTGALPGLPHFKPTAKCVIYLFQSGGPSQMELFDYKPRREEFAGTDLPGFVVMISPGAGASGQPLYDRLWGSGFLPTRYQGVKFRSVGDPVLYLSDPPGFQREDRRVFLDTVSKLNQVSLEEFGDPEI